MTAKDRQADINVCRVFGTNLKACREMLGITIHELAKRCDVTPAAISQIENHHRIASLPIALRISKGLGAKLSRLLGET